MRVAALAPAARTSPAAVHRALAAHLCRCTGWQPIVDAVLSFGSGPIGPDPGDDGRRRGPAGRRSRGATPQAVGAGGGRRRPAGSPTTPAPADALVAIRGDDGTWHVAETLTAARALAGRIQGRRSTAPLTWPLDVPAGDWTARCRRRGSSPATSSPTPPGAHRAASRRRRWPTVGRSAARSTPRSPPSPAAWPTSTAAPSASCAPARTSSAGVPSARRSRPGSGPTARASCASCARRASPRRSRALAPGLVVEEVDVAGPPTSAALRAAGWAEAAILLAALGADDTVTSPDGATATAVDRRRAASTSGPLR